MDRGRNQEWSKIYAFRFWAGRHLDMAVIKPISTLFFHIILATRGSQAKRRKIEKLLVTYDIYFRNIAYTVT